MRSASIARTQLKTYTPTFIAVPAINDEPPSSTDNMDITSLEIPDSDLMPLIKLFHSVYIQKAS